MTDNAYIFDDSLSSVSSSSTNDVPPVPNLNTFSIKNYLKVCPIDPKSDEDDGNNLVIVITGPTKCGKTYLLRDWWLNGLRDVYKHVVLFCGSNVKSYSYLSPLQYTNGLIYLKHYDPGILNFMQKKKDKADKEGKLLDPTLIIFDDCNDDHTKNDKTLESMFKQGRHLGVSIIYICQDFKDNAKKCRGQLSHLVVFRQQQYDRLEELIKVYFKGWIPKIYQEENLVE